MREYLKNIETIFNKFYHADRAGGRRPEFEYDPNKSEVNLEKHGIDFEEAQELRDGDVLELPATHKGEKRVRGIGRLSGSYWTAIFTVRGKRVRIISVWQSTPSERSAYDRAANEAGG